LLHGEVQGTLSGDLGLHLGVGVALVGSTDQSRESRTLGLEVKFASQRDSRASLVTEGGSVVGELVRNLQAGEDFAVIAVVACGNIELLDIGTVTERDGDGSTSGEGTSRGESRHVEARELSNIQLTDHSGDIVGVGSKKITLIGVVTLELELHMGHGALEGGLDSDTGILVHLKLVNSEARFMGPLGSDFARKSRVGIVSGDGKADAMGSLGLDLKGALRVIIVAKKLRHSLVEIFELRGSHF